MRGLHVFADLLECQAVGLLADSDRLRRVCVKAVQSSNLTAVGDTFVSLEGKSAGAGVSGIVLLAESHLSVRTWSQGRGASIDVYVCNFTVDNTSKAFSVLDCVEAALLPLKVRRQIVRRGVAPVSEGFEGGGYAAFS